MGLTPEQLALFFEKTSTVCHFSRYRWIKLLQGSQTIAVCFVSAAATSTQRNGSSSRTAAAKQQQQNSSRYSHNTAASDCLIGFKCCCHKLAVLQQAGAAAADLAAAAHCCRRSSWAADAPQPATPSGAGPRRTRQRQRMPLQTPRQSWSLPQLSARAGSPRPRLSPHPQQQRRR